MDTTTTGLFKPPSDKYEAIMMPGALGGANYGNTTANLNNGMMYIMTQEYASIYHLKKVEKPKNELSKKDVDKVKYSCISCHGPNMEGGVGPSLLNLDNAIFYDEFENIVINGKGVMPGEVHIDEITLKALFQYLGGNPDRRRFRRGEDKEESIEGPVWHLEEFTYRKTNKGEHQWRRILRV
ncbi:c-type cytochrome [Autumnicola psychrophila]|uniref:C-type cytochrome n=1 Tax=Autumnicola psychrophila TaxID=3075592 RepID=A0ABU3DMR7_9FLAO|nr:c-type cytochrome [Zunongwangia sp. F225]MDT0685008.1 c-type cytochrome [Zunongwangia sp. F225]